MNMMRDPAASCTIWLILPETSIARRDARFAARASPYYPQGPGDVFAAGGESRMRRS
jgi:hypothetical protein